jgi:methyl-accepting chemotaxis protein
MSSFSKILDDVKAVDQLQDQIKRALEEQTSGSHQILEALTEINVVTQAVRSGSKEMTEEGTILVDRNQKLNGLSAEVRARVQNVAQAAQTMNLSSAAASSQAGIMSHHIAEVASQVARFKV